MSAQGHTLDEFISTVLVPGVQRMTYEGLGYLATGMIAVGIEFLGACLDEHDFRKDGESEKRFKKGIAEFMGKVNAKYIPYNNPRSEFYLYEQLRCGMAHIIRPAGKVVFTGRGEAQRDGLVHLEVMAKYHVLILVVEDFCDEFIEACERLRRRIPKLTNPKVKEIFLPVREA